MSCGDKKATVSRPDGTMIFTLEDGNTVERDTVQCVHCQKHWIHEPGSGKVRGWCFNCKGFICGPDCAKECIPAEKMLEIMEGTRNPTAVSSSTAGMALTAGGIWAPGDN